MMIIILEGNGERHRSTLADFIHSIELINNLPKTVQKLDNEAVCRRLNINKRTLQSLRDTNKIPFSIVGHKR